MYRNVGLPATQPLHLSVQRGTAVRLFLSERGDWDRVTATVDQLKNRVGKWGFTVSPIQHSIAAYGTHDVICLRLELSDKKDEDRRLSDKQIAKLRSLANTWCTTEGKISVTEIYQDRRHLNTEVSLTVTDGIVPFIYAPPLGSVEYEIREEHGAFKFLLATPVGKNAEDPLRAATIVAEELKMYLPERPDRRDFKRRNVIEQTFGDNFM